MRGDGTIEAGPPPPPLRRLSGAPRLGLLAWLGERLAGEGDAAWSVDGSDAGVAAAARALESGADLVVGAWPGAGEGRGASPVEVLGAPTPIGLVAGRGSRLGALGLPDPGPPDIVADRFAPWLLAAAVLGRGGRVALVGEGPAAPAAGVTTYGRAWLVGRALRQTAPGVLSREDWLRLGAGVDACV